MQRSLHPLFLQRERRLGAHLRIRILLKQTLESPSRRGTPKHPQGPRPFSAHERIPIRKQTDQLGDPAGIRSPPETVDRTRHGLGVFQSKVMEFGRGLGGKPRAQREEKKKRQNEGQDRKVHSRHSASTQSHGLLSFIRPYLSTSPSSAATGPPPALSHPRTPSKSRFER